MHCNGKERRRWRGSTCPAQLPLLPLSSSSFLLLLSHLLLVFARDTMGRKYFKRKGRGRGGGGDDRDDRGSYVRSSSSPASLSMALSVAPLLSSLCLFLCLFLCLSVVPSLLCLFFPRFMSFCRPLCLSLAFLYRPLSGSVAHAHLLVSFIFSL